MDGQYDFKQKPKEHHSNSDVTLLVFNVSG